MLFDAAKKETALETLKAMCLNCGDKHSDDCPLAKAVKSVDAIPVK